MGIAAFVVLQLVLPLRYYVGAGHRYDERFAWRMFSEHVLVRCDGRFEADGRALAIEEQVHRLWSARLARGQNGALVRRLGAHLCERLGARRVTLQRACREPGGSTVVLEDGRRNLCDESGP